MKNIKLFEDFDELNVDLPDNNDGANDIPLIKGSVIVADRVVSEKVELIGSFLEGDHGKFLSATADINHRWSIKEDRFWNMYMKNGSVLNLFKQGDKHILALYKLDSAFDNSDSPVKLEDGTWVSKN